ncbi:MAG: histidine kinase dimerization/phospho-acceptor domain-containing protein [Pseudomonadota bacterium]
MALVWPATAMVAGGLATALAAAAAVWRYRAAEPAAIPAEAAAAVVVAPAADLFDRAPIGIAYVAGDAGIVAFNDAFAALCGREAGASAERLRGARFVDLVAPEDRAAAAAMLQAAAAPGARQEHGEFGLVGAASDSAGRSVAVYVGKAAPPGAARGDAGPESGPDSGPDSAAAAGLVLHLIDITNFKELENQVVQARKMQAVGQLAGGVAHDFNNLLTAMIGFCDLLLLRHRAGDQSFADIMQIKQNANRAASLVRQLLAFSRQQTLRPKVLDVTDTLAELSQLLRRLIGQNVVLKIVHGRDLGWCGSIRASSSRWSSISRSMRATPCRRVAR